MKIADIPSKFQIPFANAAGGGYIRTIPQASQIGITNGAASLTDGFPPLTFLPVGSGGVPPFGQDFNGILNQITQWSRWGNAGGLVLYDSTFSAAIGGYPKGALLASTTAGLIWLNLTDDNTTNPDSSGANWVGIPNISNVQVGAYNYAVAGGSANALTAALTPAPAALAAGMRVVLKVTTANTAAATLNMNGLGAVSIIKAGGAATAPGDLSPGIVVLIYDGTAFEIVSAVPTAQTPRNFVVFSSGSGNWTVPAGVYQIFAQINGGGGGGGGALSSSGNAGGSGGGGGQYAEGVYSVTPGQVLAYVVGAGGTSGSGSVPSNGGSGGSTSLGGFISAGGGGGGSAGANANQNTSAGAGGTGGSAGANGRIISGNTGGFSIGFASGISAGGAGGSSPLGGAPPGININTAGQQGIFPGGGATGGAIATAGNANGGTGASGQIVISY